MHQHIAGQIISRSWTFSFSVFPVGLLVWPIYRLIAIAFSWRCNETGVVDPDYLFLWVVFALLDPDPIRIRYGSGSTTLNETRVSDPDPDPHGSALIWVAGSRTRAKMTHKNRKKSWIFMFLSTGCSLLMAEGFSCSLGVLYGGLGISKLQFLIIKIEINFPAIHFFQF